MNTSLKPKIIRNTLITFLYILSINCFAQQNKIDIVNPTIDPEWHTVIEMSGLSGVQDMIHDEQGNIYLAGFFENFLSIDSLNTTPKMMNGIHSKNHLYICKLSPKGKPLWINSAIGDSRAFQLIINKDEELLVLGEMYSKTILLSSNKTDSVQIENKSSSYSATFLCKYNLNGTLLKTSNYSFGDGQELLKMNSDGNGNLYLWGAYFYRDQRSSNRSHLIVQLDQELKKKWEIKGDTISISQCQSLGIDKKGHLFVSIRYEGHTTFGNKNFYYKNGSNNILTEININGGIVWAKDSLPEIGGTEKQSISSKIEIDAKGNPVLFSKFNNKLYISDISMGGNLIITSSFDWKNRPLPNEIKLLANKNFLIFGGHYGTEILGEIDGHIISTKNSEGTIAYVAEYDLEGHLLWAQTNNGHIVNAFPFKDKFIVLTKAFNTEKLHDTLIKRSNGNSCWTGQYNYQSLLKMDINTMSYEATRDAEKHQQLCKCEPHDLSNIKRQYMAPLNLHFKATEIITNKNWHIDTLDVPFDQHYMTRLRSGSNSRSESQHIFHITTDQPTKLRNSQNAFSIILSPCVNESGLYTVPSASTKIVGIKYYVPDFDLENTFDSTTAYTYKLLNQVNENKQGFGEQIQHFLFEDYIYEDDSEEVKLEDDQNLIEKINLMNKEFGLDLELNKTQANELVDNILNQLDEKDIDLDDFILNTFILKGAKNRKLTLDDETMLKELFGYNSIDQLYDLILPKYSISFFSNKMKLELSNKILRKWDSEKNENAPANIFMNCDMISIDSKKELIRAEFKEACISSTEITGTGITIDFRQFKIDDNSKTNPYLIISNEFPLLVVDSVLQKQSNPKRWLTIYDTLATEIPLIKIEEANLEIPIQNHRISAKGKNIILNNFLITGSITIKIEDLSFTKFNLENNEKAQKFIQKYLGKEINKLKIISVSKNEIEFNFLKYAKV